MNTFEDDDSDDTIEVEGPDDHNDDVQKVGGIASVHQGKREIINLFYR